MQNSSLGRRKWLDLLQLTEQEMVNLAAFVVKGDPTGCVTIAPLLKATRNIWHKATQESLSMLKITGVSLELKDIHERAYQVEGLQKMSNYIVRPQTDGPKENEFPYYVRIQYSTHTYIYIYITVCQQNYSKIIFIYQPFHLGIMWHKVNFRWSLTGLNSDLYFS